LNSASSLKQHSVDTRSPTRTHYPDSEPTIQTVFALSPKCCVSGEATNTNFLVFGLTRSGLKSMSYRIITERDYLKEICFSNNNIYNPRYWIALKNTFTVFLSQILFPGPILLYFLCNNEQHLFSRSIKTTNCNIIRCL
jgi:hypothetical protein